jgi:hypothetical protein
MVGLDEELAGVPEVVRVDSPCGAEIRNVLG